MKTSKKIASKKPSSSKGTRVTRGFSLLEMVLVVAIIMTLAGISFISFQPAVKNIRTSNAFNTVLQQMRSARQSAVEKREQYIVCFGTGSAPTGAATPKGVPGAQNIQIYEWPSGAALSAAVQISSVDLPFDTQFQVLTGYPATSPDSMGYTAINFDQGVTGGAKNQIVFQPDGSARDTNGNLNTGVIYMARTGDMNSPRAITLFGASGATRGWRLINQGGLKWVVQ